MSTLQLELVAAEQEQLAYEESVKRYYETDPEEAWQLDRAEDAYLNFRLGE